MQIFLWLSKSGVSAENLRQEAHDLDMPSSIIQKMFAQMSQTPQELASLQGSSRMYTVADKLRMPLSSIEKVCAQMLKTSKNLSFPQEFLSEAFPVRQAAWCKFAAYITLSAKFVVITM